MRPDVIDLRQFYRSSLGQVAQRIVRHRLRVLWPNLAGQRLLGLGFATPFLRPFRVEAERVVAVMPANQGVLHWPPDSPNIVCLAEEDELPFPDATFDRVVLAHALETSEQVRPLLREVWRVMTSSGRLVVVVPNRRGIWARLERSPFGHGHPYSPPQLDRLLRESMFLPGAAKGALYMPPVRWRALLGAASAVK
ncbi:MAG: class I SAM-dependent methyltransferase, partial [Alphaproteobacteria bacterium]|nr:class I SAM-dependent methyltransferase [Alphaproteobacteria bacterium]